MRCSACVGLALLACLLASGCGQPNLRDYEPVGLSAECLLPSLAVEPDVHFVVRPIDMPATVLDLIEWYGSNVAGVRSSTWGFRMLCALVDRYFGDWDRLIIIERFDHAACAETGFIVVAVTRDGVVGVTNFGPEDPEVAQWRATAHLRTFRLDRAKFQSCLAELDKAREDRLLTPFVWYECTDLPFYFLHDVKREPSGRSPRGCGPITSFHFAFSGWVLLPEEERTRLLNAPRDYARAEEILRKYKPWQAYDVGSEADKELRKAGATYASLLSLVWESTLGRPDPDVIGISPCAQPRP